jgi:hypothetical protein
MACIAQPFYSLGMQLKFFLHELNTQSESKWPCIRKRQFMIVGTCRVVQEMLCHKSHECDSILELVANTDNLMLIYVKFISWIVCRARSLTRLMDSTRRFILPSVLSVQLPGFFSAIMSPSSVRTRATAFGFFGQTEIACRS